MSKPETRFGRWKRSSSSGSRTATTLTNPSADFTTSRLLPCRSRSMAGSSSGTKCTSCAENSYRRRETARTLALTMCGLPPAMPASTIMKKRRSPSPMASNADENGPVSASAYRCAMLVMRSYARDRVLAFASFVPRMSSPRSSRSFASPPSVRARSPMSRRGMTLPMQSSLLRRDEGTHAGSAEASASVSCSMRVSKNSG
mmetsp:Transcript_28919/g.94540  ORF Transcript_28919/g.94540 Transcript_28919/m.94540 type:complete len:201 (+) Transcript_28919:2342-2944(+)